jgi:hypothetical protein
MFSPRHALNSLILLNFILWFIASRIIIFLPARCCTLLYCKIKQRLFTLNCVHLVAKTSIKVTCSLFSCNINSRQLRRLNFVGNVCDLLRFGKRTSHKETMKAAFTDNG